MPRKYSKARRSFCLTPSPSAYMRPSFQAAIGWPLAAAYSSALNPALVSPAGPARRRDGAVARRPDLLGIFPDVSRCVGRSARLPRRAALRELGLVQPHLQGAAVRIDRNDVAVAHQRDRPADRSFRADMAHAEA